MGKTQRSGVQALALQPLDGLLRAIQLVPRHRVAEVRQMHPNLVGATGLQPAAQVGEALVPAQHLKVGDGLPGPLQAAVRLTGVEAHRHLFAVL